MLFCSINIYSQTSTWTGGMSAFTHGNGTQANPYLIENAEQLAFLAQIVNAGSVSHLSAYYRMTVNINLNNIGWTPIGISFSNHFNGNFDGDGHTIANVTLETSYFGNGGIFGYVGGIIRNLGRIGNSNGASGGIVGYFYGIMIDCYNKSNISANSNAGGLTATSTGVIKRCYNTGNITSLNGCAGGIVGYSSGGGSSNIPIIDYCYNSGNINGSIASGGIVGQTEYTAPDDCGWAVWNPCCKFFNIRNCYNKGQISGGYGAIMGNLIEDISSSVTNCHFLNTCGGTYANGGVMQTSIVMTSAAFVEIMNTNNDIGIFEKDTIPYQNNGYPIISNRIKISSISNLTPYSVHLQGSLRDEYAYYQYSGFRYKPANQSNYLYINMENQDSITLSGLQYNTNYEVQYFVNRFFDTLFSKTYYFRTANLPITPTNASICQGETYFFMDSSFSITGIYPIVENDTIHQLNLTVYPLYNDTLDINVCNGESFTFNDTIFSSSCYHTFYFQSIHGCDSIVTLHLTVLPEYRPIITITIDTSICRGDSITLTADGASSYLWNTNAITQSITVSPYNTTRYIVTASNSSDCYIKDTVIVTVKALPSPSITGTTIFCDGNSSTLTASGGVSYLWNTGDTTNSIVADTAGIYSVIATGSNGCSKDVQKNVTVRPLPNLSLNINDTSICLGESLLLIASGGSSYVWSSEQTSNSINVTPNSSTAYSITAYNSYNCSKSDTVNIIVNPVPILSCVGDTSICSGSSTNITIYGAENYLWSNGETSSTLSLNPSSSTQYTVIGTNSHLCSSTLSIPITVHQPTYTIDTIHSCNSYTWIDGITYSSNTNTPTYTLTSIHGCDSTVNLNLTIHQIVNTIDYVSACNSFTWINGITYTQSTNSPTYTLNSIYGCDSIVNLNLTMNYSSSGVDNQVHCKTYTWINGITYTSSTNTPTYTFTNFSGCDSIVRLNLRINPLPNVGITGNMDIFEGDTTELRASGANYYSWSNGLIGQTIFVSPTQTTQYSVAGADENNCTNTASITINVHPPIGLNNIENTNLISIYPNPTSGKINIIYKSNESSMQKIILLNVLGEKIVEKTIKNENEIFLDLSPYSSNIIFMEILLSNGEKFVKKIIKK